jgi:hypothetical protein
MAGRVLAYTGSGIRLFTKSKNGITYPQLWTPGGAANAKDDPLPPVLGWFNSSQVRMTSGNKETPHNRQWVINICGVKPTCAFLTRNYKQDTDSIAKALLSAILKRNHRQPIITYNGGGSNVTAGTVPTSLDKLSKLDGAVDVPWVEESGLDLPSSFLVEVECDEDNAEVDSTAAAPSKTDSCEIGP